MADLDFEQVEITGMFVVAYSARCVLEWDHQIKIGQRAFKVQRKDNPMLPVSGAVCQDCAKRLSKAKK